MAPIATFIRRGSDTEMKIKKYSTAHASNTPINKVKDFLR